jgi:hypothetical protein
MQKAEIADIVLVSSPKMKFMVASQQSSNSPENRKN